MPTILNSNSLGIYQASAGSTTKPSTFESDQATDAAVATEMQTADKPTGYYIIKATSGNFNRAGLFTYDSVAGQETFVSSTFSLLAAATSSSLEIANAISDVARDAGQGGVVQEATNSFTISAEGLMQASTLNSGETGKTLLTLANEGKYLIANFRLDVPDQVSGTDQYFGIVLIDSLSISGSVDETATYSATFSGVDSLIPY